MRKTLGAAARLCPDANQGYDPQTAIRVLRSIEDLDIMLLEEPCRIDYDRGRRQVAGSTTIPLMGDESCTNLAEVRISPPPAETSNLPELTGFLDMTDDLLVETPKIENGMIRLPERPGLGIQVDEAKLRKYRI